MAPHECWGERWLATFTESKSAAALNEDVGYLEPHCDSVCIVGYPEAIHLAVTSPMVRLAGQSAIGRQHSADWPSNTAGVPRPKVQDRLAQADFRGVILENAGSMVHVNEVVALQIVSLELEMKSKGIAPE